MFRVAITTTPDRGSELAAIAANFGLQPVILPCIEVRPAPDEVLEGVRASARQADWILITSSRVITAVWPRGGIPETKVAAVGRRTANAVIRAGGNTELVGDSGASELITELEGLVPGKSVLFPHARGADMSTVQVLESAGAEVSATEVYWTAPISPQPDPVDTAAFGSPSAVEGWSRSRSLDGIVVAAIGKTTCQALADRGRRCDLVPERPDYVLLLESLAARMNERSKV